MRSATTPAHHARGAGVVGLYNPPTTPVERSSRVSEEQNDGAVDVRALVRWAEQTQRNIDFLAGQQAQFSADSRQSREEQERERKEQRERWAKADARWAETEKGIRALLAIAEIHEREIEVLKDSQEQTGKQLAETGERVDALVDAVEQLISKGRNGGGAGSGEARGAEEDD